MKRLSIGLIILLTFVGCSTKGAKSFAELGEPDAFCEVIQKPDPLLMGTWEGRYTRAVDISNLDKNYIKYQLIEYKGKYALYFYRTWRSGQQKIKEWKKWTINGQEITGVVSRFSVHWININQGPAGPVLRGRWSRRMLWRRSTAVISWFGPRFAASTPTPIWGICFQTARNRPACGIA